MERLKAAAPPTAPIAAVAFTFQYGEIKSSKKSGVFTSRSDLHSSMERLKDLRFPPNATQSYHLHSSMERLKGGVVSMYDSDYDIYIPVWRD